MRAATVPHVHASTFMNSDKHTHTDPNEETKIRSVIEAVGSAEFQDRVHTLAATFKRDAIDEPSKSDRLVQLVEQLQLSMKEMRAEQRASWPR